MVGGWLYEGCVLLLGDLYKVIPFLSAFLFNST